MLLFLLAYNLAALAGFFALAFWGPRSLVRGLHPVVGALIPPPTPRQKRQEVLAKLPLILVLLGLPYAYLRQAHVGDGRDFGSLWLEGYLILMSFNLVDLLVIDGLVLCWWTPKFLVVPGTEGHPAYKDFGFHFRASLKGAVLLVPVSAVLAGVAAL